MKLDKQGYINGPLHIYALWFDPDLGLDGRIAGLLKIDNKVYVADLTCAVKFWWWGKKDSLRRGWQVDDETQTKLIIAIEQRIKKTKDIDKLRSCEKAIKTGDIIEYLPFLKKKKKVFAWRIWNTPHKGHWHADIGHASSKLLKKYRLFPKRNNVPHAIETLIKDLGAMWPEDHIKDYE